MLFLKVELKFSVFSVKEKLSMTLVKTVRQTLFGLYHDRHKEYNGVSQ